MNTKTTKPTSTNHNDGGCPPTDFGGPIGCLCTMILLPLLVVLLAHWAKVGYLDLNMNSIRQETLVALFGDDNDETDSLQLLLQCLFGLVGWFVGLVVLWVIVPGQWVEGAPVIDPELEYNNSTTTNTTTTQKDKPMLRLKYKLNGHSTFWIVMGTTALAITTVHFPLNEYLYNYYEKIALMDILLCFGLSTYLYIMSFLTTTTMEGKKKILSHTGRSNNHLYDYFMGRELNPRCGQTFDWKQFCELRPGLFLWLLLNIACAQEQYKRMGSISGSMIVINIFHFIYVWDSVYQEKAILTTMDITTDGFGFMLIFGDLTWVPFTYNHPTKYLVNNDPQLSFTVLVLIVLLYVSGYTIFRLSNLQKNIFRTNPQDGRVSQLTYLVTQRGTRLLTSGWWGHARKINYTGDYLMGVSYSLLCGVDSIVPYYYSIYFLILLVHRSIRDDELCLEKYGNDWLEYKRIVPYRFIPGIV